MKNNKKICKLNDSKKQIALTGTLALPLRVGERALISYQNQSIITSSVKQILEVSDHGVIFETCNTLYDLTFIWIPIETGVLCA